MVGDEQEEENDQQASPLGDEQEEESDQQASQRVEAGKPGAGEGAAAWVPGLGVVVPWGNHATGDGEQGRDHDDPPGHDERVPC